MALRRCNDMFSSKSLRANGFEGFVTWAAFDQGSVPKLGGVYIVLGSADIPPSFQTVSCGGHFKGRDPAVGVGQLQSKWVSGTETVYIGKATSLRARLRQYRAFGAGRSVGHCFHQRNVTGRSFALAITPHPWQPTLSASVSMSITTSISVSFIASTRNPDAANHTTPALPSPTGASLDSDR